MRTRAAAITIRVPFAVTCLLVVAAPSYRARQRPATSGSAEARDSTSGAGLAAPALSLADLERMALARNPTLPEAQADVRASEGRKLQSGLYPNPTIGYEGRAINSNAFYRGGEHGLFVEQPIVTGGKLGLSRKVFATETEQARAEAAAQRQRVLNGVRIAYYRALGAQARVELTSDLSDLARRAAATSGELANVGQADQPDVLEARVDAGRARLDLLAAQSAEESVWQELAATVGDPALPLTTLAGKLDDPLPAIDPRQALATILSESPEVQTAAQGVTRAEEALKRARAEKLPNLDLRGGMNYSRELLGPMNMPMGWEGEAEIGLQIPLFNRNQGNVRTAEAELTHARHELERVQLNLRANFAAAFHDYAESEEVVSTYRDQILPDAEKAYQLYLAKYREMAAAYPQVLIAQRTWFQLREEYTTALVTAWESAVAIQGFLLTDGLAAPLAPGEPATLWPGVEVKP
ncbi:MAG TPA: TolC family protein [Terriglobia bacterium]|nr:TolC family protein [Terriglobia bacterium]